MYRGLHSFEDGALVRKHRIERVARIELLGATGAVATTPVDNGDALLLAWRQRKAVEQVTE